MRPDEGELLMASQLGCQLVSELRLVHRSAEGAKVDRIEYNVRRRFLKREETQACRKKNLIVQSHT
jgi:hypothetical protein